MTEVLFISPKHPFAFEGGDMRMVRLNIAVVAELAAVRCVAMSDEEVPNSPVPVKTVPKHAVNLVSLARRSVLDRRSMVHTRFRSPEMVEYIRQNRPARIIAEHTYVAENAIDAVGVDPSSDMLWINSHVREHQVVSSTGRLRFLRKREAERIERDELRCFRIARSVAAYDREEASTISRTSATPCTELQMLLPPASARSKGSSGKKAVFVGDLKWPPNLQAVKALLRLWPEIHKFAPTARLQIVGNPAGFEADGAPSSIDHIGFVENLDTIWRSADLLFAPLEVGGGVRVKILEAACNGVPVVSSPTGLGSIDDYLPIVACNSDEEMVEEVVRLLSNEKARDRSSQELYEANRNAWSNGFVHKQLEKWLEL